MNNTLIETENSLSLILCTVVKFQLRVD